MNRLNIVLIYLVLLSCRKHNHFFYPPGNRLCEWTVEPDDRSDPTSFIRSPPRHPVPSTVTE